MCLSALAFRFNEGLPDLNLTESKQGVHNN